MSEGNRNETDRMTVRGLEWHNHNPEVKNAKGAAISAVPTLALYDFYVALLEKGMRPTMARLTLAQDCQHHSNDLEESEADFGRHNCIGKKLERL